MLVSQSHLEKLAFEICDSPQVNKAIEEKGQVDNADIVAALRVLKSQVRSERSLAIIQQVLCEL